MSYFFDELDPEIVDEMESRFIDCVVDLLNVENLRRRSFSVKYRKWKISISYYGGFQMRGRMGNVFQLRRTTDENGEEYLYLERFSYKYRPNNMLLAAVCMAYEINSEEEFEKFISTLKTAAVSVI